MSDLPFLDENYSDPVKQLILLPAANERDLARWGAACAGYAQAFRTVAVSSSADDALSGDWDVVFVVQPDEWPASLRTSLAVNRRPDLHVEEITAPTPEILAQVLNVRVYHDARFGEARERPAGPIVSSALVGLHGRGDGTMQPRDLAVVRTARIEAVKLLTLANVASVDRLLEINPNMFIMLRPFVPFSDRGRPRNISPRQFFDAVAPDLERFFNHNNTLTYVEIHNEPNLLIDGQEGSWRNGSEFADWYLTALDLLRARFPGKLFGFPGLSPGGDMAGYRYSGSRFLDEAQFAAWSSDWIGVHCYWVSEAEMTDERHGYGWQVYRRMFPDHQLWITEFGNPNEPKNVVGDQYRRYYDTLKRVPNIGGAFAYISSISDARESRRWAWVSEDGQDVGIAPIVAQR